MRTPASQPRGFTLLEVLIAVSILSLSLTSLLSSQMTSMRATRYAQDVTAASFLAEYQLVEIEWQMRKDGWIDDDKQFEGDFGEQGWPDVTYQCLVDFVELPEYSALARAVDASEGETEGSVGPETYDTGEQAFDAIGMVWPVVKAAIEGAIRKVSCTVYWQDGNVEHDFEVQTFWTDPQKLSQLPELGGASDETDDSKGAEDEDGGSSGGTKGGGSKPNPAVGPMGGGPGGGGRGGIGGGGPGR